MKVPADWARNGRTVVARSGSASSCSLLNALVRKTSPNREISSGWLSSAGFDLRSSRLEVKIPVGQVHTKCSFLESF